MPAGLGATLQLQSIMISRPFSSLFSASISPLSRTRPHRILRPLRSFATKAEQDAQAKVGRVTSRCESPASPPLRLTDRSS